MGCEIGFTMPPLPKTIHGRLAAHTSMSLPRCTRPPTGRAAVHSAKLRSYVPQLETARLHLRCPETRDFSAWLTIFSTEDAKHIGGPMSEEQAWNGFTGYISNWLLHGHGLFSVERKDNEELVGFVFIGLEWDDYEPELGWLFTEQGRGRGFATEAAKAACTFAADLLGPGNFVSYIDANNNPSILVAQRLQAKRDTEAERVAANDGDPVQVWRHGNY